MAAQCVHFVASLFVDKIDELVKTLIEYMRNEEKLWLFFSLERYSMFIASNLAVSNDRVTCVIFFPVICS